MTLRTRAGMGRLVLSAGAALALIARVDTTPADESPRAFLLAAFGITGADMARLDAGQVIARSLNVADSREVTTLGAVRIAMSPQRYVARLADIASFKRDHAVLQIGAFGDPPRREDVAALTLEPFDIEQLRACRVGRCGVQLPAAAIHRFGREIDWQRPDASREANRVMHEVLTEYVIAYRTQGATLAMQYDDRPATTHVDREFASLAAASLVGWPRFPALLRHVREYPAGPAGTTAADVVYWSKEKVGRRAVITVTHLAIADTSRDSPADYAIASKHIYGSHYYDASLGLTILLRDRAAPAAATYLVYVNRSRVDVFGGLFGAVARKVVTAKARSTVSDQLARLRHRLEAVESVSGSPFGVRP